MTVQADGNGESKYQIYYYLTVFPLEALIASQLEPAHFGSYLATGPKKGSAERIIFIQVSDQSMSEFDWEFAKERCVVHSSGDPKHSLYLSVYRTLEYVPLNALGNLYLANPDGRTLEMEKAELPQEMIQPYFLYQELCPINPVVVSKYAPAAFGKYLTNPENKISVPKIVFADMKPPDLNDPKNTGNVGTSFDRRRSHLLSCISSISGDQSKPTKVFSRSPAEFFSFQMIKSGIFVADHEGIIMYRMPGIEEIRETNYDWGRSANII